MHMCVWAIFHWPHIMCSVYDKRLTFSQCNSTLKICLNLITLLFSLFSRQLFAAAAAIFPLCCMGFVIGFNVRECIGVNVL